MAKVKMTKSEQAVLDMLDDFIYRWRDLKDRPLPEIHLFKKDAKAFNAICKKIDDGMARGRVNPQAKTYRDVPIRCQ